MMKWPQAVLAMALLAANLGGSVRAQTATNPNINAQLLVAARQSDLSALERSLGRGAAPNSRNRLGRTALLMAAEKGHAGMAERLLAAGADVNLASLEGVIR